MQTVRALWPRSSGLLANGFAFVTVSRPSMPEFRLGKWYVIPVTYPLKHEECGAVATAVRYQMRAPWADRSPALARLEFDLFIGIAQADPNAAVEDIEGILDVGVVVPVDLLRGAHPQF
jgi:hypothetical protein